MAGINDLTQIFHHIRVKLYPNYLPKAGKGTYIARTDSDKTVNVKDICTIMVTRTGFDGDFNTLHDYVNQFLEEVAYQLCDGNAVNLTYLGGHVNIGGVFTSQNEAHDHEKHPVGFRFTPLAKLRALIKNIDVEIEGIADTPAYIDEFIDLEANVINSSFKVGNGFAIHGHNIKIEGNHPDIGVYFHKADDSNQIVQATRILENTPTKIVGIAPTTAFTNCKVAVMTQYSGGSAPLKDLRIIRSPFTIDKV